MAGRAGFRYGLAAGLLALLTGCTTPPVSPVLPATAPATSAKAAMPGGAHAPQSPSKSSSALPAESRASDTPESQPVAQPTSGLADFIARRFRRSIEAAQAQPEPTPAEPQSDADASGDKKYQLTGEQARELERGKASWFGTKFHGRLTANGETYDKTALTAAHKTLPFGTIVRVRSLELGTEVDVRINDRGPFAPGRVIDVSQAAAEALGLTGAGVGTVSLKVTATALRNFKVLPKSSKRHASARRSTQPTRHTRRKHR